MPLLSRSTDFFLSRNAAVLRMRASTYTRSFLRVFVRAFTFPAHLSSM